MARLRPLTAAGITATLLLAACGDETEPAATVNDLEVSQQDVIDELEAIEANTEYVEAYEASATQASQPPVRGTEEGTFDAGFVSTTLSIRIQYALVRAELEDRDITVAEECRDAAEAQVAQRFAAASATGDGEAVLAAFGETYSRYLVDREADFLTLQAALADQPCAVDPDDDVVRDYFEAHRDEFAVETACASHILVESQGEAEEIAGLLAAGGDFAALAAERSTDPGSGAQGGDLGCGPAGRYVPEFEAAVFSQPVGEVGPPVQTEFGFHLILVTDRGVGEFDDVRDQVEAALAQEVETGFFAWFDEALAAAEITIDRRYGTWDPTTASITRPASEPASTSTTLPAAEE